jgi:hypothetical protein
MSVTGYVSPSSRICVCLYVLSLFRCRISLYFPVCFRFPYVAGDIGSVSPLPDFSGFFGPFPFGFRMLPVISVLYHPCRISLYFQICFRLSVVYFFSYLFMRLISHRLMPCILPVESLSLPDVFLSDENLYSARPVSQNRGLTTRSVAAR